MPLDAGVYVFGLIPPTGDIGPGVPIRVVA